MSLSSGTKLGPYEIQTPLGAGGMGEVYLARDTRLSRRIAIKVLSAHLSESVQARQRFEREARAISSMSHPNICQLYDVGEQNGTSYLVMEYLEGETLADRLLKGPLPFDQLLKVAIEICEGLEKAHGSGLVHRDLKPSNIMLSKNGTKLMDFGLATAAPASVNAGSSSNSLATMSQPLTAEGTIVGTFQYISPEQIEGKEADARSDIFSLGAVLYEMVTGKRAFEHGTTASTMAAILASEPKPMSTIKPMSPTGLEQVVKTCLAKDPEERLQTVHDLKLQLKWIAELAEIPKTTVKSRHVGRIWKSAVAIMAAAVVLLALESYLSRTSHTTAVLHLSILPPTAGSFSPSTFALSANGEYLAFGASVNSEASLWVRALDSSTPKRLAGTDGAVHPFWSPDGRALAFFADGTLKTINVAGGPPQTVAEAPIAAGGTWNEAGLIVFAPSFGKPLYRVSAAGGPAVPLTTLNVSQQEGSHLWPHFLPDGKHVVYLARSTQRHANMLNVTSLDGGNPEVLVSADAFAGYTPPGYLLILRGRALLAVPFDAKAIRVIGEPIPILENVEKSADEAAVYVSCSQTGLLLSMPPIVVKDKLMWVDRKGAQIATLDATGDYSNLKLSLDGRHLAANRRDPDSGSTDVWILDLERNGVSSRFTFDPNGDTGAIWSNSGDALVWSSDRSGIYDLYRKAASGAGDDQLLFGSKEDKYASDWSKDGKLILFDRTDPKTNSDVWVLPMGGQPYPLFQNQFNEFDARLFS